MNCQYCETPIIKIELDILQEQPVIYISTIYMYYFCNDVCLFRWLKELAEE